MAERGVLSRHQFIVCARRQADGGQPAARGAIRAQGALRPGAAGAVVAGQPGVGARSTWVWAVGLEDSLIQRLATLAVILGDVCLGDACDDACHLAKYMFPHVLFCETVRAVHDVVRSSTEVTLAYLASAGPGAAGERQPAAQPAACLRHLRPLQPHVPARG